MVDTAPEEADPRVRLAEERTFLAWHRTALALIAGGLALAGLTQTSDSDAGPRIVAIAIIAFAGVVAGLNERRHRHAQSAIEAGRPLPASRLPLVLTLGVLAICLAALALIAAGLEVR